MSDRKAVAQDVAKRLGITTTTLHMYVNGDGSPKAEGSKLLASVVSVHSVYPFKLVDS
jgi:transcriptional regulator with XRE-family HTH domain